MKPETPVRLCSFNGTHRGPRDTKASENYWLLVGSTGVVHSFNPQLGRYLVVFDRSVSSFGLHCHNPVPNSLYIAPPDLVVAETGSAV